MSALPHLWQAGLSALLLVSVFSNTARADTHPYEDALRIRHLCSCQCDEKASGYSSLALRDLRQCEAEPADSSRRRILPSPKTLDRSDRPARSRPAYSRKSNRAQRA